MVRKEKLRRIYGSHVAMNMSFHREPDFLSLNKSTQTDSRTDELAQEKRPSSNTSSLFVSGKEKYYMLNTKTKLVREKPFPAIASPEPGDFFPTENWKKEDTEERMEYPENIIALQPDEKGLNEVYTLHALIGLLFPCFPFFNNVPTTVLTFVTFWSLAGAGKGQCGAQQWAKGCG